MPRLENVVFVNSSPEVIKAMQGLSRTALRSSGKVVRRILRERVPVRSKRFKNHIASWALIDRKTGQPKLQVGFYSWQKVRKRGKKPSNANPHWIEFGTNPHTIAARRARVMKYEHIYGTLVAHPGTRDRHVLRNAVFENIAEIRKAQEDYLKELNNSIERAKGRIVDSEEPEDD